MYELHAKASSAWRAETPVVSMLYRTSVLLTIIASGVSLFAYFFR